MPYDEPTVRITVELRVRNRDSPDRWEWRACEIQPEAEDYLYTHHDMCAAVRGYATLARYSIPAGKYPRWRIMVRGYLTRHPLASYEWRWDETEDRYVPDGTPFCWWPPIELLPPRVINGAARYQERTFQPARVCGAAASCLMPGRVVLPAQRAPEPTELAA